VSIFLNAVCIGWSCEWAINNPSSSLPMSFVVMDWVFLIICMFELALRMIVQGRRFFYFKDRMFRWNMFDSLVITVIMMNELSMFDLRLSVVRVFRVLRLVYVVRMIRVIPWFRELRILIDGIMKCGRTLLWSTLIMLFITYVYAVVCLQLSADWLSLAKDSGVSTQATERFLQAHFPSLIYSIYTLFKAVTGGISWGEVSDPLQDVNVVLIITFPFYIIVSVFCVLNIVTAAFVEAASRKSQDCTESALNHLTQRSEWIDAIQNIFAKFDDDEDNMLSWEEFSHIMVDWKTREALEDMGIDISFEHAALLFKLFDSDGDGHIDVNEFAHGIHHLKGNARSVDMYVQFLEMSRQVNRLRHMVSPNLGPPCTEGRPSASSDPASPRRDQSSLVV